MAAILDLGSFLFSYLPVKSGKMEKMENSLLRFVFSPLSFLPY